MTPRLLLAAAAVGLGSAVQAQFLPYYGYNYGYGTTVNPLNGTITQPGATVDPYSGLPTVVSNGYNPYTGAVGRTVAQYNPFTGTTTRADQAVNPYTGAGFNTVRAYNPYLNNFGYGLNPYVGNYGYGIAPYPVGGYNPNSFGSPGRVGLAPSAAFSRPNPGIVYKPSVGGFNFRR